MKYWFVNNSAKIYFLFNIHTTGQNIHKKGPTLTNGAFSYIES